MEKITIMARVCIVNHSEGDVRVWKEAKALKGRGYEVDIIGLRGEFENNIEVTDGITIYRLPGIHKRKGLISYLYIYFSFFCLATVKLCSLYFKKKYDFIQINTLPDFLVFVAIIPKYFGAKVILDLHEPTPELFSILFGKNRKLLLYIIKLIEQISIRYCDCAITVSEQMRNNYIKRGASADKIKVILNVPDLELDQYLDKKGNNDKDHDFSLVCHGAMLKRYGQDVAIKAIRIVKEKIPTIRLNIIGYGDYKSELEKLVSKFELNHNVCFCGFIPFSEMVQIILDSDVGIVPIEKNAYSDLIHTNKMFEYIALNKPVIISRTKAVEDFFGKNDACLKYFESGNEKDLAKCIIELYHNSEMRDEMVKNASKKFESIRWNITKSDYCGIYEKFLPKHIRNRYSVELAIKKNNN